MKLGPATARVRVAGLAGESIVYTRGGLALVGPPARGSRAPARPERDPRAGRARPAEDSHGSAPPRARCPTCLRARGARAR
jgi:hypothetical protein